MPEVPVPDIKKKFLHKYFGIPTTQLRGDGPYPCPLHARTTEPSLHILTGSGARLYFRCTHNDCRFTGDVLELLRKADTPEKAIETFYQDDSLARLIFIKKGEGGEPAALYSRLHATETQADLKDYLSACKEGLARHPKSMHMKSVLDNMGVRSEGLYMTSCGINTAKAPAVLDILNHAPYSNKCLLLLPYFNGPTVTHIAIFEPMSGFRDVIRVDHSGEGLFMEREMSWPFPHRILVADAVDALLLHSRLRTISAKKYNVTAATGPEALLPLRQLGQVHLLSHPGNVLTVATACAYKAALPDQEILVNELNVDIRTNPSVAKLKRQLYQNNVPLWPWLAQLITKTAEEDEQAAINMLQVQQLDESLRQELIGALKAAGAAKSLIKAVDWVSGKAAEIQLGNTVIRRDRYGFHMVKPEKKTLTDFTIHADFISKEVDDTYMHGWLKTIDQCTRIVIPTRLLKTKMPICDFIRETVKPRGINAIIYSEPLKTGTWYRLLSHLDNAPHREAIPTLGRADNGNIYWPNFYIDAKANIRPVPDVVRVSPEVQQLYRSLTATESTDLGAYREVFQDTHPSIAGLAAALSHVVYTLTVPDIPRHLLFYNAESDSGRWLDTLKQLTAIFSDKAYIPPVPDTKAAYKKFVKTYHTNGNLPLICQIPKDKETAESFLRYCPSPIIALADSEMVFTSRKETNVTVVRADIDAFGPREPYLLDRGVIEELRRGWPHLIQAALHHVKSTKGVAAPVITGAAILQKVLGLASVDHIAALFGPGRCTHETSSADDFMRYLRRAVSDHKYYIASNCRQAIRGGDFAIGWRHKDGSVYLIQSRSSNAVRKTSPMEFTRIQAAEWIRAGYNFKEEQHYARRCWKIAEELWPRSQTPKVFRTTKTWKTEVG